MSRAQTEARNERQRVWRRWTTLKNRISTFSDEADGQVLVIFVPNTRDKELRRRPLRTYTTGESVEQFCSNVSVQRAMRGQQQDQGIEDEDKDENSEDAEHNAITMDRVRARLADFSGVPVIVKRRRPNAESTE